MSRPIFKLPQFIVGAKVNNNQDGSRWYEKYIDYKKIETLSKDIIPLSVWLMDDTAKITNNDLNHSIKEIWEFTPENFESGMHGHHTGGIIASKKYGLSPRTKIGFAKVLTAQSGQGYPQWMILAVDKAKELKYRIISASLGSDYADAGFKESIAKYCDNGNNFFFAAAGNDSKETDYPAAWADQIKGVFAVGAAEYVDGIVRVPWYSSSGTVTFCFPGSDVLSTLPNNESGYMSGTSMATPFGPGLMSLVLGAKPDMNFDTFMSIARYCTTSISDGELKDGIGFVDVVKFLEFVPNCNMVINKSKKCGFFCKVKKILGL